MEEFDDRADIYDSVNFDEDIDNVDNLFARLDRLQKLIAKRESIYTAAVQIYNTALRAAYDQFSLAANEYQAASETASRIASALTFAMRVRDEANEEEVPGWDQSKEGRQLQRWIEIWDDFDNAVSDEHIASVPGVKPRKTPLSEMITALPRRPEDVDLPEVGRAIAPKVKAAVESSWKRIDAWLAKNAPKLAPKMHAGATAQKIAEAEATLGVELPEAARASYLVHDGSGIMCLFPSGDYLTLDQMLGEAKMWKEILSETEFDDLDDEPVGPVQHVHFHPRWFPLTNSGGGDYMVIDLAPAEGGKVGQLVDFSHETGPECVAAPGLAEYLAYLADGLEGGAVTIGDDTYLIWHDERDTPRSGYVLPKKMPVGASVHEPGRRYFEFKDGTSSKFWEIACQGVEMTTRYGKIGTKGQSTTKALASPEKAASEAGKVIAKKVKEGYVEVRPSEPSSDDAPAPPADIEGMLATAFPSASARKRRLFAVACCRHVEFMIDWAFEYRDDHYRAALDTSERFADGQVTEYELGTACDDADDSWFINIDPDYCEEEEPWGDPFRDVASEDLAVIDDIWRQVLLVVRECGLDPDQGGPKRRHDEEERKERATQAALLRDISGDPFPPPAFDPAWRTPEVVTLAEGIYAEKAFDRMPALADALEQAGCDNQVILGHCRGAGPHVRGCWVVDGLLGKE